MTRKPRTVLRVRQLRCARVWTLKYAAKKVGYGTAALCMIEKGQRQPSEEQAKKLAAIYGVSVDELLEPIEVPA